MDETLPLFHEKPYLKQVECRIQLLDRDDGGLPFALLDETLFYPQGGGQLGDRGLLNVARGEAGATPWALPVLTTKKKDEQIRHYLGVDDQEFEFLQRSLPGQKVIASLFWPLRYHQMRIHSAMHLLHCMLEETLGRVLPHPVRSPLSDEGGENHYEFVGEFDEQSLKRATDALNEFCSAGHEIRTEADTGKGQGYRWWRCGKWSIPCGGVHVRNTQEIGLVTASMKVKKNTTRVAVSVPAESEEPVPGKRAFGAFLTQLRIQRGHLKISTFLDEVSIPFSANYYRDVEAGRKHLSIDTAVELHDHLGIETDSKASFDYFWHYFRDLVPGHLHEMLFGKGIEVKDLASRLEVREYDSKILRRALSLSRYEREFIITEDIIEAFRDNFELLPLMTYLYMVDSASVAEIRLVCQQIGLDYDQHTEAFLNLIAKERSGPEAPFVRHAPTLRMPRSEQALKLKDQFLRYEIERSLPKPEKSEYFDVAGSFKYSSKVTLKDAEIEQIQDRLVDLFSVIEVHNKSGSQLEDAGAHPYFFGLVVSGRPEYDGRAARTPKKAGE